MKYTRNLIATFTFLIAGIFLFTMDMSVQATTTEEECVHVIVTEPEVAPTCTENGKTKRSYCSECKMVFENPWLIEALGHKYTTVITKATPKKDGSVSVQCVRCGEADEYASYTIYKPKLMLLSEDSVVYTGKAKKLRFEVVDNREDALPKGSYKISYKNNKNVGTATVTVTFKGKYYTGKLKKTFSINPKKTEIKDITVWENTLTVKWKAQKKQVTGYQIQYSTKKNFKGAKNIWVKNYKKSSKKIAKLKENTTYYIRLRSYKEVKVNGKKKKFFSEWNWNLMQKDTEQKIVWTKPYQLTDTSKIVYKEGYTYVNTTVSSYEEACAVARDIGYPLWQFVDQGGDNVWYYGMFGGGRNNRDIFEKDFYRVWDQYDRFLEMRGYTPKRAGESLRLNTKDGRIYIPDVNGGVWALTSYEIDR